jgi:two-component system chemotaxis response regulator CheB
MALNGRLHGTFHGDFSRRDIVVIGGSAGASEALYSMLPGLPAGLPASLFVLLHRTWRSGCPDPFPDFVARKTSLAVKTAADWHSVEGSTIYIAPPDSEMFFESGRVRIKPCPMNRLFRNGIDKLFRSAADVFGPRVVAVLLSGMMTDGREGLWEVRKRGGLTMVQDSRVAKFPDLPRNAISDMPVHYCLQLRELAEKLGEVAGERLEPPPSLSGR